MLIFSFQHNLKIYTDLEPVTSHQPTPSFFSCMVSSFWWPVSSQLSKPKEGDIAEAASIPRTTPEQPQLLSQTNELSVDYIHTSREEIILRVS